MKLHKLPVIICLMVLLTGCRPPVGPTSLVPTASGALRTTPPPATASYTPESRLTVTPTLTVQNTTTPWPSRTPRPPTQTPLPSYTPTVSMTPTVTPPPGPLALSVENVKNIKLQKMWGKGEPTGVLWSPDGRWIVIGTKLGVYVYDAQSLVEEHFIATGEEVNAVAVSPDSRMIATGGLHARLWNLESGRLVRTLQGFPADLVVEVAFSPGGNLLAAMSAHRGRDEPSASLTVWQVQDGSRLYTYDEAWTAGWHNDSIVFLDHGRVLGFRGTYSLPLLESTSGKELAVFDGDVVSNVVHTPYGASLTLVGDNGHYKVQDLDTGEGKAKLQLPYNIDGFILDPTGRRVLELASWDETSQDYYSRVTDVETGKALFSLKNVGGGGLASFSPDGEQLIITKNMGEYSFLILDAITGRELRRLPWTVRITTAAFGVQNGRPILAVGDDAGWVRLIDPASGGILKELKVTDEAINALGLRPDGKAIAISFMPGFTDTLQIVNLQSDQFIFEREENVSENGNNVVSLAFSQDEEALLLKYDFGDIRGWNWKTNFELHNPGEKVWFNAQPWGTSWNGHLIDATLADNSLTFYDRLTGEQMITVDGASSTYMCEEFRQFSVSGNHGYITLACETDLIPVWDLNSGNIVTIMEGHQEAGRFGFENPILGITFDPYDRLLATSGSDNTVRFWDPLTGERLITLSDHTDMISDILFSPDGRYLVTFSSDGTLRLWGLNP